MKFSQFMASPTGRMLRILMGAVLIILGLSMHSIAGYLLTVIGSVVFLAGLFDWCLFAPLFKMPFHGKAIRACSAKKN